MRDHSWKHGSASRLRRWTRIELLTSPRNYVTSASTSGTHEAEEAPARLVTRAAGVAQVAQDGTVGDQIGGRPARTLRLFAAAAGAMLLAGTGVLAVGHASGQDKAAASDSSGSGTSGTSGSGKIVYSAVAAWQGLIDVEGVVQGTSYLLRYGAGVVCYNNNEQAGRSGFDTNCFEGGGGTDPKGTITIEVDKAAEQSLGIHAATIATKALEPSAGCGRAAYPWVFPAGVKTRLEADYKNALAKKHEGAETGVGTGVYRDPLVVDGLYKVALTYPIVTSFSAALRINILAVQTPSNSEGIQSSVNPALVYAFSSNYNGARSGLNLQFACY